MRSKWVDVGIAIGTVGLIVAGCSSSNETSSRRQAADSGANPAVGSLGGSCTAGGACDPGLYCAAGVHLCVPIPATGGGTGAGGVGGVSSSSGGVGANPSGGKGACGQGGAVPPAPPVPVPPPPDAACYSEVHEAGPVGCSSGSPQCSFDLPKPPLGTALDPALVDVSFTPSATGVSEPVAKLNNLGDCSINRGQGWYFDSPGAPTKILICPGTCSRFSAGTFQLLSGCVPLIDLTR